MSLARNYMHDAEQKKREQGYDARRRTCGECKHLLSHREAPEWAQKFYKDDPAALKLHERDAGLRCEIGLFSVKKSSTCQRFERKA